MQWNSPLVHNGMPQGTINSSHSSTGIWVSLLSAIATNCPTQPDKSYNEDVEIEQYFSAGCNGPQAVLTLSLL